MLSIKKFIHGYKAYTFFSAFELLLFCVILILSIHPAVNIYLEEGNGVNGNAGVVSLPFGTYEVKIDYDVDSSVSESAGAVLFKAEKAPAFFIASSETVIKADDNSVTTLIYNNNFLDTENISFYPDNYDGNFTIKSITFMEKISYRITAIFFALLFLAVLNYSIFYFFIKENNKNRKKALCIIGLIFISSLPFIRGSMYEGHDLRFHLNRIIAIAQGMREGNWRIYIQQHMIEGYGYATPIFYPQMFLYFPALLYSMYVPIGYCYSAYVVLINTITCLIAWYSFGKIARNNKITFVVCLLYCLSLYRLTNVYIRAAAGEYTAMTFLPLVLYGFYNIFDKNVNELTFLDTLPIVFGLSGVVQSHILSLEMTALFVTLFLIINIKKVFNRRRFVFLCIAAVLTLLLNVGVLTVLLYGMKMKVYLTTDNYSENIQNHALSLAQLFTVFPHTYGTSNDTGTYYDMPLSVGIGVIAGCFIMLSILIFRDKFTTDDTKKHIKNGGIGLALFALAIWMTTDFFPWDAIGINEHFKIIERILSTIQFPWRLSEIAAVIGCYVVMEELIILSRMPDLKYFKLTYMSLTFLTLISTAGFYDDYLYVTQDVDIVSEYDADSNDVGMWEYLPQYANLNNLTHDIIYDAEKITLSDYHYDRGVTYVQVSGTAEDSSVIIPKLYYEGYVAYDNETGNLFMLSSDVNKAIVINIPANYKGTVCIKYRPKRIWIVAEACSIIILICLAGTCIYQKKKNCKKA